MIEILKAPPFATVQDLGWRVGRRLALPRGGAMDPPTLRWANRAVGNPAGHAALEWALGPGRLRFLQDAVVAITRDAHPRLDGSPVTTGVLEVPEGGVLELMPGGGERFGYLAVRGGIAVPPVLGSRSTFLPGGFGGFEGRRLRSGDRLPIGANPSDPVPDWAALSPGTAGAQAPFRVVPGPQWYHFAAATQALLLNQRFTVSAASDRMGYRLLGPSLAPVAPAALPSEPACAGAIQVPDSGEPIVLMPDGPTVGGYPKVAVVVGADLPRLAQCQPGREVRFTPA